MDSSKSGIFYKYASDSNAKAQDSQVIKGEKWRITVITDSLLRLEWSDDGEFADTPTQTVVRRNFASKSTDAQPQFITRKNENGWLEVETEKLHLTYNCEAFSKEGLSIVVRGVPCTQFNTWHYGDACPGNLLGTFRTLDQANGPVKLGKGILSRDGWAIVDDSSSCEIVPAEKVDGKPNPYGAWVKSRAKKVSEQDGRYKDLYFFGYGHRYIQAIQDFYKLTGAQPLLPRFALSNWWSRYYRYRQDEYLQLHNRFKREGIPFSTAVIDMDWHVTDVDPKYGSGWTGYTWNEELFPDHRAFFA